MSDPKYRTIKFLPGGREVEVEEGETIIKAARRAGIHINASCGGSGVCGKCRILVEEGEVCEGISEKLSAKDIEAGYRLACSAIIKGDLTVRVPVESGLHGGGLGIAVPIRHRASMHVYDIEDLREEGIFSASGEVVSGTAQSDRNKQYGRCQPCDSGACQSV